MYLFLNCSEAANLHVDPPLAAKLLRERLQEYGGLIGEIRESISDSSSILYRPLDSLLLPGPWYRGRIMLIGDAVHATTPHLASGAGMAVEDALVLTDELARSPLLSEALEAFMARRFERCRLVVESSVRLGAIEQAHGSTDEHAKIMRDANIALAAPI